MMNAAPDLLSPGGSSTGHNSSISTNNMVSPELHEPAYLDSSLTPSLPTIQQQRPNFSNSIYADTTNQHHHDNSNISQQHQQASSSASSTHNSNRKVFKTEYKSKFTPFDQYVYHEASDSFVKQSQLTTTCNNSSNSRSSPLPGAGGEGVTCSRSNQDLASFSAADHQFPSSALPLGEGSYASDLSNGQHQRDAAPHEQITGANEPWYKEVMRRNEKANEYRFKSELGHNSPLLNFNRADSPTCFTSPGSTTERHLLSPCATETGLAGFSETTAAFAHSCDSRSQTSAGDQDSSASRDAEYKQPQFRFTPSDYRQHDHLIAHMANNNNFNLPKEERASPHSQSRRAAQLNSSSPGAAASSSRATAARSSAQVRSRSQSTRRQPLHAPTGGAAASSKAGTASGTATTKSNHTTPTHTTRTPISGQRVPSASRVQAAKSSATAAAHRATSGARPATTGSGTKTSVTPSNVAAAKRIAPATSVARTPTSRLTNGTRTTATTTTTTPTSGTTPMAAKRLPVNGTTRHSPAVGPTSRARPAAASGTSPSSKASPASSRISSQRTAQTSTRSSSQQVNSATGKTGSKSSSNAGSPSTTGNNNAIKSIKTPAAAAAKAELELAAAAAATIGVVGVAALAASSPQDEPIPDPHQPSAFNMDEQTTPLAEQPIAKQLFEKQFDAPPEEESNLIFNVTEAGNMLADELAHAEREASNRAINEQQVIDLLGSESEPKFSQDSKPEKQELDTEPPTNSEPEATQHEAKTIPELNTESELDKEYQSVTNQSELEQQHYYDNPTDLTSKLSTPEVEVSSEDEAGLESKNQADLHSEPVTTTQQEPEPEPELDIKSRLESTIELESHLQHNTPPLTKIEDIEVDLKDGQESAIKSEPKIIADSPIELLHQTDVSSKLVDDQSEADINSEVNAHSDIKEQPKSHLEQETEQHELGNNNIEPPIEAKFVEPEQLQQQQLLLELTDNSIEGGPATFDILAPKKSEETPVENKEEPPSSTAFVNGLEGGLISTEDRFDSSERDFLSNELDRRAFNEDSGGLNFGENPSEPQELLNNQAHPLAEDEDHDEPYSIMPEKGLGYQQDQELQHEDTLRKETKDEQDEIEDAKEKGEKNELADVESDDEDAGKAPEGKGEQQGLEDTKMELLMDVSDLMSSELRMKQEMARKAELARKDSSPVSYLASDQEVLLSPDQLTNQLVQDSTTNNILLDFNSHANNNNVHEDDTSSDGSSKQTDLLIPSKGQFEELEKVKEEDEEEEKKEDSHEDEKKNNKADQLIETQDDIGENMIDIDPLIAADAIKQSEPMANLEQELEHEKDKEQHGELHRQLNISQHERKLSAGFTPESLRRRQSTRSSSSSSSSASSSASSSLERVVQGDIKSDYDELAAQITADLIQSPNSGDSSKTVTESNG